MLQNSSPHHPVTSTTYGRHRKAITARKLIIPQFRYLWTTQNYFADIEEMWDKDGLSQTTYATKGLFAGAGSSACNKVPTPNTWGSPQQVAATSSYIT